MGAGSENAPDTSECYESRVRAIVRQRIGEGVTSFNALCSSMDGAFPDLVYRSAVAVGQSFRPPQSDVGLWSGPEPEPHPLDFDWRFTEATVDRIIERVSGNVVETSRRSVTPGSTS